MQPNNQNGYWQPEEGQPVQPASPPPVTPAPTPVQPVAQPFPPAPAMPIQAVAPQPAQLAAPQPVEAVPTQPQALPVQDMTIAMGAVALDSDQVYAADDQYEEDDSLDNADLSQPVNWQATEYIHQEKDAKWFVIFGIVLLAMLAVAILFMKSWTFAVLLVVIAVVIVVFAKRPPRILSYSLSDKGLHIGDTLHHFADFKGFGLIRDGEEFSVMLIPTKRFQPGVTVYFPEESGEAIVDMLGARLPMQDLKLDAVDKLVRKLRL